MTRQEQTTANVLRKWNPSDDARWIKKEIWVNIRNEFIAEFEIYDPDHFDRREFIKVCNK